jgi:hypothetical protein
VTPVSLTIRRTPAVTSIISIWDSVSSFNVCTRPRPAYHTAQCVIKR